MYDFFIFFHVQHMLRFDKATFLSPRFEFILIVRSRINLWGSDILLFLELINNVVSILYCIEFVTLLYNFLIILFAWYKENIIRRISFSKFFDLLPVLNCASNCAFEIWHWHLIFEAFLWVIIFWVIYILLFIDWFSQWFFPQYRLLHQVFHFQELYSFLIEFLKLINASFT